MQQVKDNVIQLSNSISVNENDLSLKIDDLQLDYYRTEFTNEKEEKNFIRNVEALVRKSIEYREFIEYLTVTLGYNYCLFTHETMYETKDIEVHHHPFSLYNITYTVLQDKLEKGLKFSSLTLSEEILQLHYKMYVGLIPLVGTLHNKFHNGFLDIPIELVIGNYMKLFELYKVPQSVADIVNAYRSITLDNVKNVSWYIGIYQAKKESKEVSNLWQIEYIHLMNLSINQQLN